MSHIRSSLECFALCEQAWGYFKRQSLSWIQNWVSLEENFASSLLSDWSHPTWTQPKDSKRFEMFSYHVCSCHRPACLQAIELVCDSWLEWKRLFSSGLRSVNLVQPTIKISLLGSSIVRLLLVRVSVQAFRSTPLSFSRELRLDSPVFEITWTCVRLTQRTSVELVVWARWKGCSAASQVTALSLPST